LGTAWIGLMLAGLCIFRQAKRGRDTAFWITVICLGQIVLIAVTGVLQCETARVWIFMIPLLMVPVGLELDTWRLGPRMAVYFCVWMLLVAIGQNMRFLYG
jgi:hypothetical protein